MYARPLINQCAFKLGSEKKVDTNWKFGLNLKISEKRKTKKNELVCSKFPLSPIESTQRRANFIVRLSALFWRPQRIQFFDCLCWYNRLMIIFSQRQKKPKQKKTQKRTRNRKRPYLYIHIFYTKFMKQMSEARALWKFFVKDLQDLITFLLITTLISVYIENILLISCNPLRSIYSW